MASGPTLSFDIRTVYRYTVSQRRMVVQWYIALPKRPPVPAHVSLWTETLSIKCHTPRFKVCDMWCVFYSGLLVTPTLILGGIIACNKIDIHYLSIQRNSVSQSRRSELLNLRVPDQGAKPTRTNTSPPSCL